MMIEIHYTALKIFIMEYKKIGIPIVFDFHHHKFCDGGMSEKDAFNMAVSTWGYQTCCSLF